MLMELAQLFSKHRFFWGGGGRGGGSRITKPAFSLDKKDMKILATRSQKSSVRFGKVDIQ